VIRSTRYPPLYTGTTTIWQVTGQKRRNRALTVSLLFGISHGDADIHELL
jgi:hypothetical protein